MNNCVPYIDLPSRQGVTYCFHSFSLYRRIRMSRNVRLLTKDKMRFKLEEIANTTHSRENRSIFVPNFYPKKTRIEDRMCALFLEKFSFTSAGRDGNPVR